MNPFSEEGRKLFVSTENLRRSAPQLNSMWDAFWDFLLENKIEIGTIKVHEGDYEEECDDWVKTAQCDHVYVKQKTTGRGKPKTIGSISAIVRLCGTNAGANTSAAWPWLDQACFIVAWHKTNEIWCLENFEPTHDSPIEHRGNGLWVWAEDDHDFSYFFVLPLFSLTSEEILFTNALKPLEQLFNANDPTEIAAGVLRDIPVLKP